ncbi:hypothetical protein [Companilactobacillus sp. DQM5]|uniref:hypothetical protein n=1 Tax=Companilactobacillus sp. DQM5 TaxID=3463359 RepID=UPI0040592933
MEKDIDVAQQKANKLVETLKKANSLADELAHKEINNKQLQISKVGAAQVIKIDL